LNKGRKKYEKNISAEQPETQAHPWLPGENEDQGRPRRDQQQKSKGPQAVDRLGYQP